MRGITLLTAAMLSAVSTHALAQTQSVPAGQLEDAGPSEAPEIIVTGLKASLQTNAQIKKNATEIVDSITATDIGKLPDANVAETLTRVPGVQAYRFGGEAASPVGSGSGITVRGLTGQTASRTNGRAYFTAGQRDFNIEGTVPAIVAGVDVFKNPSAEHIEGGIGGVVNVRTRKPLDLKGLTATVSVGGRYNDLEEAVKPEVFGLLSKTWNVGEGELGILLAGSYLQTVNRGDNTPGPGGVTFRRAINGASAEYAAGAGSGLYNPAYVGRADINYLADVNPSAVAGDRSNIIAMLGQNPSINYEMYVRTRKGANAMIQYKPSSRLEFYLEGVYNWYRYHQEFGFLGSTNSRYVRDLRTRGFQVDEAFANRNINGGANEALSGQLLTSGTFLGSAMSVNTGVNNNDYETAILAGGVKWQATDSLHIDFDASYVKATQRLEGRGLTFAPAAAMAWDLTRDLSARPTRLSIGGPDVANASTWVYNDYGSYPRIFKDDGLAVRVDAIRSFQNSLLKEVKFGLRYATQNDSYRDFTAAGRFLTTNGAALAADRSNAIGLAGRGDIVFSPRNFMDGQAGYAGGYLMYDPNRLLGNSVRGLFPLASIPAEGSNAEVLLNRRRFEEKTYAGYAMGSFGFADDAVTGNAGVRVVRTDTFVRAQVNTASGIRPNEETSSYTDVLPSLNLTAHLSQQTQVRFGYGKGITRPDPAALNPSIIVNDGSGTASVGNAGLRPQKADSFDFSLEHYFSGANYVSLGLFYKRIDGFFSATTNCESVAGYTYNGAIQNGCSAGQYLVTRTVNAQRGNAKGVEIAGQTFFDYAFVPTALRNFGAAASFTYVDTKNPILLGNGMLVDSVQPFTSKYNYTLTGMYEDSLLSARLVYTYRSKAQLFGLGTNPVDSRYIQGFGLLDASLTFNLPSGFQLSLTASNLTNAAPNRFFGEPGFYSGVERQHFVNGRVFGAALRWKLGG